MAKGSGSKLNSIWRGAMGIAVAAVLIVAGARSARAQLAEADSRDWHDALVARVNGTPILLSDLREAAFDESIPLSSLTTEGLKGEGFRRAVTLLVHEALLVQEAQFEEIAVNESEVSRRIDSLIENLVIRVGGEEEFAKFLKRYQLTIDTLRHMLTERERRQEMATRLIAKRVNVSNDEVAEFSARRKAANEPTEEIRLAQLLILCSAGEQATPGGRDKYQRALDTARIIGQDAKLFFKKARAEDAAPFEQYGLLGWLDPRSLRPEIRDRAARMQPGEICEPITTEEGFHILYLMDRRTPRDLLFAEKFDQERSKLLEALVGKASIEYYPITDPPGGE